MNLDHISYAASHDLREPLVAVAGYATMIANRCPYLPAEERGFLEEILVATRKMEQRLDDILAFSRANTESLTQTVFPLSRAVQQAIDSLSEKLGSSTLEVGENLPSVRGHEGMITLVLQNLLGNALKYKGPNPLKVTIRSNPCKGPKALVQVQDNGIGFGMKHSTRIFELFQRLHTAEEYPGTGLGLAISKTIVERHGGHIWAESVPGVGSTFRFTLLLP